MAGLFMCLAFALGLLELLGFDLGGQSWLPWLPSELHLGFLGFDLGVPTRHGSGKVFLSTSDTQIVQT